MKTIFTLLIFLVSFGSIGQTYTEIQVPNIIPMTEMVIEIEKDEVFYILNRQVGLLTYSYILINKTNVVYTLPTLPSGWTIQPLYKANKSIMPFDVGGTFPIILDNNGCSYLRIH